MRNDHLSSHNHEIVYADSSPFPASFVAANSKLGADFPRSVKEEPDVISFLHSTDAARNIRAVVEDKWDCEIGCFHRLTLLQEVFPQLFSSLSFLQEDGFGLGFGSEAGCNIGRQFSFG